MMTNEQCYSLAVEKLLGIEAPLRAQYIRGDAKCFFCVPVFCIIVCVLFVFLGHEGLFSFVLFT